MKTRVDVEDLRVGMEVVELDRPWIETPFLFQGFTIRDDEELAELKAHCEYVFIQTDSPAAGPETPHTPLAKSTPKAKESVTRSSLSDDEISTEPTALEEELFNAQAIYQLTLDQVQTLFEDVRSGRMFDVQGMRTAVERITASIIRNPSAMIWFTALKDRDNYTAMHSINVSVLAVALGRFLGLHEERLKELGLGALMHDIGKLRVPIDILNKPEGLTRGEFEVMKQHTTRGYELLAEAKLPESALEIAFSHHEANNGSGYPRGLLDEQIDYYAKLISVVDKYDAVTGDRLYRDGVSPQKAITLLYGMRGPVLDEGLVNEFIRCLGVYPIGSLVELTSEEVGIVLSVNQRFRLRPKVLLVRDEHKRPYLPTRVVDLAHAQTDANGGEYSIRTVLDPGSYGIDTNAYIKDLRFDTH